jgi:hypothetical protein
MTGMDFRSIEAVNDAQLVKEAVGILLGIWFGVVRGVGYYRSYLLLMIINNSTYGK